MRVAVITTSLDPEANELWDAASQGVAALKIFGSARTTTTIPDENYVPLREIDLGKGLIWRHLVGLTASLRKFSPDIVHVNGELWSVTAQWVLLNFPNVTIHGAENIWDHGNFVERQLRHALIRWALKRCAGYASWNEAGRLYICGRMGGVSRPTLLMPGIVPSRVFRNASWDRSHAYSGDPAVVVLVGRAVPEKGFETVIRAVAEYRGKRPINLKFCGEGPESLRLGELARSLRVDWEPLGHLTSSGLAAHMKSATLLVQPSVRVPDWTEQFGRAVAEASAVGLPSVVSDAGELPRLVDHDRAAIFPQGDHRVLSECLTSVLNDPPSLLRLSAQQLCVADRLSPQNAAPRIIDFWNDSAAFWTDGR